MEVTIKRERCEIRAIESSRYRAARMPRRAVFVVAMVVLTVLLAQGLSAGARADSHEHAMVPAALTAAEAHRLLSEARWPDGAELSPRWTLDAWLAVEAALDRHAESRQRQLAPLIVELNREFPAAQWYRSMMLDADAHTLRERAVDVAVGLERELFEDLRRRFEGVVPTVALSAWRAAIDRAERRRRRAALLPPARLFHGVVSDVEWHVRDATPEALDDPVIRESLDRWAVQLDGRLEALTRAERAARERFRAALDRLEIDPVNDLAQLRLRGGDAYPLWLDASAKLRSAIAAEIACGRSAIDAIVSRLDAHHGASGRRTLVDRWHRVTYRFPVRMITGSAPVAPESVLATWSESELASREASALIIERHSPARWPLQFVSPLPSGLLETLIPPLEALAQRQRQRTDAVTALAAAHGSETATRIKVHSGDLPDIRWSVPSPFDARRVGPVRLLGPIEHFGSPAPESLCLRPPTRGGLGLVAAAIHGEPARRAPFMAMVDALLASSAAVDLELGDRRDLPISFLGRPRGEPVAVLELLDREERRTERQMALERDFFTRTTMLADPADAPLLQLVAAARRVDHLLQPTLHVIESEHALADDRRASTNPLTIIAYTALEARASWSTEGRAEETSGRTRIEWSNAVRLLDRAVDLALDAAPEIERLATMRGAEARAFRREHLPKFMSPDATIPADVRLDRAAARWWRADDGRRREAARLHDQLISSVTEIVAPDDQFHRRWLAEAWPTIHGLEPKVRSSIAQSIEDTDRSAVDRLEALDRLLHWLDDRSARLADAAMAAMTDMPPSAASMHLIGDSEAEALKAYRSRFESTRRELAERAAVRLAVILGE